MKIRLAINTESLKRGPLSSKNYLINILEHLPKNTIQVFPIETKNKIKIPLNQREVDLLWIPHLGGFSTPPFWVWNLQIPIIGTFHGAAPYILKMKYSCEYPRGMIKYFYLRLKNAIKWRIFKNKLSNIITVSHYAKREFRRIFNVKEDKIHVIYHGVNHNIFKPIHGGNDKQEKTFTPYILHVSQYQPKKNINAAIKGFEKILTRIPQNFLLVAPGYNFHPVNKRIKVINSCLSSEELAFYYRNADFLIFPSLHETFGLPILEAMACGCPVITSNVTACPEVAGESALYVDPYSVTDIAEKMLRLSTDKSLRMKLRENSLKKASEFTWERSATEHHRLFEKISGENA